MRRQTILVVDDSAVMRQLASVILAEAGYGVIAVGDGPTALAKAGESGFDLVLTDWNMAPMNGGELTRQLRQLPRLAGVPILIMSTLSEQDAKAQARQSGANGWLGKPIEPETLSAVIASLIGAPGA